MNKEILTTSIQTLTVDNEKPRTFSTPDELIKAKKEQDEIREKIYNNIKDKCIMTVDIIFHNISNTKLKKGTGNEYLSVEEVFNDIKNDIKYFFKNKSNNFIKPKMKSSLTGRDGIITIMGYMKRYNINKQVNQLYKYWFINAFGEIYIQNKFNKDESDIIFSARGDYSNSGLSVITFHCDNKK